MRYAIYGHVSNQSSIEGMHPNEFKTNLNFINDISLKVAFLCTM